MKKTIALLLTAIMLIGAFPAVCCHAAEDPLGFSPAMFRACLAYEYTDKYYLEDSGDNFGDFGRAYCFYNNDTDDFEAMVCVIENDSNGTDGVILGSSNITLCIDMALKSYEFINPEGNIKELKTALLNEREFGEDGIAIGTEWIGEYFTVIIGRENAVTIPTEESAVESGEKEAEQISVNVGDIVTFGRYEQDNNLNNGPEPIEWQVLDMKDGKVMLLSKYVLDMMPYNEGDVTIDITKQQGSLRKWLNSTFFYDSFSSDEREFITTTYVEADEGDYLGLKSFPCNEKVFLLSKYEVNKFLPSGTDKQSKYTSYATSRRVQNCPDDYTVDTHSLIVRWWLRTPGDNIDRPVFIVDDKISYSFVKCNGWHFRTDRTSYTNIGVRPAMWVDINGLSSSIISSVPADSSTGTGHFNFKPNELVPMLNKNSMGGYTVIDATMSLESGAEIVGAIKCDGELVATLFVLTNDNGYVNIVAGESFDNTEECGIKTATAGVWITSVLDPDFDEDRMMKAATNGSIYYWDNGFETHVTETENGGFAFGIFPHGYLD